MNTVLMFLVILIVSIASSAQDEVKASEVSPSQVNVDRNTNGVLPTYTNIDNTAEKSKTFSWGKVYYSSVTKEDDHNPTSQEQTQLNIRYECNGSKPKKSNVQRFSFCGYAQSEIDTRARNHHLSELKKMPAHKSKTEAQLIAMYDKEYNDRIIDPAWNITDSSSRGRTIIEITVRQKVGLYGACEEKISNISIVINCK